jgi:2,3-dihydroxybiphenyl 1,2-dioxygenase
MSPGPNPRLPQQLAYIVVEARKPEAWDRFCQHTLGLAPPLRNSDRSLGWQIDNAAQRLVVQPGASDDLLALGIEFSGEEALERRLRRLELRGVQVQAGDGALCKARRVQRLYTLQDPDGNRIELVQGLARAEMPFQSPHFERGFNTEPQGFGHLALASQNLVSMEQFYVDALGFGVSERLATRFGPIEVRGTFLHMNRRHHSLALFRLPSKKRLHHFMLEATDLSDVGRAYERARAQRVPLSLGLGQHPQPDGTFSFYASTPSGFDYEIGWGGHSIEPMTWRERRATSTSAWGHHPHWRLRVRLALGWLLSRRPRWRSRALPGWMLPFRRSSHVQR